MPSVRGSGARRQRGIWAPRRVGASVQLDAAPWRRIVGIWQENRARSPITRRPAKKWRGSPSLRRGMDVRVRCDAGSRHPRIVSSGRVGPACLELVHAQRDGRARVAYDCDSTPGCPHRIPPLHFDRPSRSERRVGRPGNRSARPVAGRVTCERDQLVAGRSWIPVSPTDRRQRKLRPGVAPVTTSAWRRASARVRARRARLRADAAAAAGRGCPPSAGGR